MYTLEATTGTIAGFSAMGLINIIIGTLSDPVSTHLSTHYRALGYEKIRATTIGG